MITQFFKEYISQGSTWRGLALLGSAAAGVLGYGDLVSVSVANDGLQFGGVLGVAVPTLIGAYEVARNEYKNAKNEKQ
ncbi:hypothetical protein [Salinivibrio sp. KP-1]|uniref:hypothetical protein n=1 Tax=Salinivibrio sp. KP-1 TaxID=1406902 RepID=UPI000A7B6955|nr:hypothetical protein [Salinivibrio sp. KP-1]